MPGKLPPPRVRAFLFCRTIYEDARTRECILVAPFGRLELALFPARFRFAMYADLVCGHGMYQLGLELRDEELHKVWEVRDAEPIRYDNPLLPLHVIRYDVMPLFPRPGRYDLVLLANGEDIAHHDLEVIHRPPG